MNSLALAVGENLLEIPVRRARRKSLALHILDDGQVEVRAPHRVPETEIRAFVDSRATWLEEKLAGFRPVRFRSGDLQPYLGEYYPLVLCPGARRRTWLADGELVLVGGQGSSEAEVRRQLENWYRREAEALLPGRVAHFLAESGEFWPYQGLRLRKMRARWGSCSRRGELCLNTLLVRSELSAIDMVIAHEFCHMVHFDHSKAFYALLERFVPDWREREKLLV